MRNVKFSLVCARFANGLFFCAIESCEERNMRTYIFISELSFSTEVTWKAACLPVVLCWEQKS